MGLKVRDFVAAINGARRTASELKQIWKDASESEDKMAIIHADMIRDWYRAVAILVMMIQGFDINE